MYPKDYISIIYIVIKAKSLIKFKIKGQKGCIVVFYKL